MKILSILSLCLALQGCFWQTVDSYDIERAIKKCGSLDKVYKVSIFVDDHLAVTCKDFK